MRVWGTFGWASERNAGECQIENRQSGELLMKLGKIKFSYTWVIIMLCFLMVFICLGFCSSNRSLYLAPITEALDMKRSTYSLSDSFRYIATAVVNLFFGTLVSKYGTKKLIGAGFISLIASSLVYAYTDNVFMFYIGSIMLGVGLSWTTTTMVGCVVNKWCKEKQGTIMGAVLAANGFGSAFATQIVTPIIYEEGNPFGYRNAYKLIALILFFTGVFILIFFKENPAKKTQDTEESKGKTSGNDNKKVRGRSWEGLDYAEIKKQPQFYMTAVCIFFTGFVLQGITGVSSAHMKDIGMDAAYIATIVSIYSLALGVFKFLIGALYDKCGLRFVAIICDMAALIAILSLALLTNTVTGKVLAMIYAVIVSLALPLETVMLPIFASDLFGRKSYNKILGLFVSINTVGYALSAPVMNWVFDMFGSYKLVFIVCGLIMAVILVCFQHVIVISKKSQA